MRKSSCGISEVHGDRGRALRKDALYSMLVCTASPAGAESTVRRRYGGGGRNWEGVAEMFHVGKGPG